MCKPCFVDGCMDFLDHLFFVSLLKRTPVNVNQRRRVCSSRDDWFSQICLEIHRDTKSVPALVGNTQVDDGQEFIPQPEIYRPVRVFRNCPRGSTAAKLIVKRIIFGYKMQSGMKHHLDAS